MRWLGKWIGRLVLLVVVAVGAMWAFGPIEAVETNVEFDPAVLEGGVDPYLAAQEAQFSDITDGTQKRVIWAGEAETQTDLAIVYLHGFSATSEEIRPVPDMLADTLGANLVFTRFKGHGRTGAALSGPTVKDWMRDAAEALEIGRKVGREVIVVATSTGATLATIAAHDAEIAQGVKGMVMVAPNYGIVNKAAVILTWPGVRWWGPVVGGAERSFEPQNEGHERYWTTSYPTLAVLPMAASVKYAVELDHSKSQIPTMFVFADTDKVVDHAITRQVAAQWGGPVNILAIEPDADTDPYHHVIAGDILSPSQTAPVTQAILDWIGGL